MHAWLDKDYRSPWRCETCGEQCPVKGMTIVGGGIVFFNFMQCFSDRYEYNVSLFMSLSDDDLEDFHATFALSQKDDNTLIIQQDLDFNSSDESERLVDLPEHLQEPSKVVEDKEQELEEQKVEEQEVEEENEEKLELEVLEEVGEEESMTTQMSDITVSELESTGKHKGSIFLIVYTILCVSSAKTYRHTSKRTV